MTRTMLIVTAAVLLMLVGPGGSIAGPAVQHTTASVHWHPQSGDPDVAIEGASATLRSTTAGASVMLRTSQLNPGHAYTLWWVIINNPEACASHPDPCTPHDVLFNTQIVQAQVTYAAGHVVGESGRATFSAHLPAGDIDDGWFPDQGFTDPLGAEIHLVVNDHGPKRRAHARHDPHLPRRLHRRVTPTGVPSDCVRRRRTRTQHLPPRTNRDLPTVTTSRTGGNRAGVRGDAVA